MRAKEDKCFIKGKPATVLLDQPINQVVNVERTKGDIKDYLSYMEANSPLPIGKKYLRWMVFMLVMTTTEYNRRVPVAIGTSITDLSINYLNTSYFNKASQSWETVCCATQTKRQVQSQQNH